MARNSGLVFGLDVGSSQIDAVLADVGNANEIIVRGVGRSASHGIDNGKIVSQAELVSSMDRALKRAEREVGVRPENVVITVPQFEIQFGYSSGLVIPKASGQISEEDKSLAIHKAKKMIKSNDQLILHAVPVEYLIDGHPVDNPLGKAGPSLEVTTHFVLANLHNVNALLQVTQALQLHVAGMVYAPIAGAQMFMTNHERVEGGILIDIGARFTSVSFFKRDLLQSTFVIPIGGDSISSDISQCLSVTRLEAERVKLKYGSVDLESVPYRDKFEINSQERGRIEIKRQYMCKIIHARVEELLRIVVRRAGIGPEFPYDIVISGGTSQLPGMAALASRIVGHVVRVGPDGGDPAHRVHRRYGTALGAVSYGLKTGAIVPYETPPTFMERLNRKLSRWF
jgi:cell division protein FtsA